jgi:formate dehydrogenase assembly factor FdhD
MRTITDYIERKLGLKVNATKTHVTTPKDLKYLGFGFWKSAGKWQARPHKDSVAKFQRKLKQLCDAQMEHPIRPENHQAESSDTGLDKLFQHWVNEGSNEKD